jgi:superfamily II DNA/RNA helicase
MTDAFEAQGEFAPVQSATHNEFTAATDTMSEAPILEALDAAAPEAAAAEEPAKPNGFIKLGLAPELIAAVADLGFTQPTTVQEKVVPIAMGEEGAARFVDLMVSSQTGSGKTAAFLLPVLHTLLKRQAEAEAEAKAEFQRLAAEAAARGEAPPKKPKRKDPTNARHFKAATPGALILCPTRELAQQVAHDAIELVRHCRGLRIANVVGGMPYQLQIAKLQNADLVVATPGRLLDLQRSQQLKLDQVKFLVVDEADRMLDLGFSDDLAEVNQLTIERQQTMMFSATFAPRIQQLAQRVMREPQRITIDSPQEKHANIKQVLFWADNSQHKRKLLDHWLRDTSINQAIVFASTQVECDGLANDLQQEGFSAVALHGALSQGLRNRRLMALRQGQVQILVATDVAGRDGLAVTFAEFRDRRKIMDIEHYSRQQFKAEVVPGMEPQQRMPQSRPPQGEFRGGRGDSQSRDRKFGGGGGYRGGNGGGNGGGYAGASGFNDRNSRGPAAPGPRGFQGGQNAGFGGGRDEGGNGGGAGYGRKPGWGDSAPRGGHGHGGGRGDGGFAPREGFAPRGNGAAGHGGPGKVFVPRDAQKRAFKPSR